MLYQCIRQAGKKGGLGWTKSCDLLTGLRKGLMVIIGSEKRNRLDGAGGERLRDFRTSTDQLRRKVVDIIEKAPTPLGAYAIIDAMSRAQHKSRLRHRLSNPRVLS